MSVQRLSPCVKSWRRSRLCPRPSATATTLEILATRRRFFESPHRRRQAWLGRRLSIAHSPTRWPICVSSRLLLKNFPHRARLRFTTFLNMHTEPSRQAPSFYQIQEKGSRGSKSVTKSPLEGSPPPCRRWPHPSKPPPRPPRSAAGKHSTSKKTRAAANSSSALSRRTTGSICSGNKKGPDRSDRRRRALLEAQTTGTRPQAEIER